MNKKLFSHVHILRISSDSVSAPPESGLERGEQRRSVPLSSCKSLSSNFLLEINWDLGNSSRYLVPLPLHPPTMNFYFEASKILDRIDAKQGSIKGILSTVDLSSRKRMSAVIIRTLECTPTAPCLHPFHPLHSENPLSSL